MVKMEVGDKFGDLTLVNKITRKTWHCSCSCGGSRDIWECDLRNKCYSNCGCSKKNGKAHRLTNERVIEKFKKVHGDTYDYSEVVYTTGDSNVSIGCRTHGMFRQKPRSHSEGIGCPNCALDKISISRTKLQEDVIKDFVKVHGSTYDYSHVIYLNARSKIEIGCKQHGIFTQCPTTHLKGSGCPACAKYGFSADIPEASIYVLSFEDITKIGITSNTIKDRIRTINRSSGFKFKEVYSLQSTGLRCSDAETTLLRELRKIYKQPVDKFDGSTECFYDVDVTALVNRIVDLI